MPSIINRPELENAAKYFSAACRQSRAWDSEFSVALMKYGAHGPAISGIGRDHFPEHVKVRLRELARSVSLFSDLAYSSRPPRVRTSTMRALSRAIAAQDGSGFYGPQP